MATKKRRTLKLSKMRKMLPQSLDKLPGPIQIDDKRLRWVGFTWIDEGEADGTEPLLVIDDD